jgi:hypothetical protein
MSPNKVIEDKEDHCVEGCMQVLNHHIYEYQKGLRDLILHTTHDSFEDRIVRKLEKRNIPYLIYHTADDKINVFFGDGICIEVLKEIDKWDLAKYSDEEDFILGIMLGYDRKKQCVRYLERKHMTAVEVLIG